MDARIAVLASGTGSNVQALLDDQRVGRWIVLVVSDRAEAGALDRARARNVATIHLDPAEYASRKEFDHAIAELLRRHDIDFVLLAGYMRILGPEVVEAFRDRILNIHPALLPAFPGARAVADALVWGAKVTGVTVHLVDEEVDHGPIVLQEAVPVLPGDDEQTLHARIKDVEHRLYPEATRLLVEGWLKIEGRIVHLLEDVRSDEHDQP